MDFKVCDINDNNFLLFGNFLHQTNSKTQFYKSVSFQPRTLLLFGTNSIVQTVKSVRDTKGIVETFPNPDYYLKYLYIKDNKMIKLKNIFYKIYDYLHFCFNKHKTDKIPNTYKCLNNESLPKSKKNEIINWLETLNHTHFLTIQFHNNIKTDDFELSKELLRQIMARFESNLIKKNWNKHHLPFIAFAERGKGISWHYHILLNSGKYTTQDLKKALDKSCDNHKFPRDLICLKEITDSQKLYTYCTKELKITNNSKMDTDRMIFSNVLFGIENKTPSI